MFIFEFLIPGFFQLLLSFVLLHQFMFFPLYFQSNLAGLFLFFFWIHGYFSFLLLLVPMLLVIWFEVPWRVDFGVFGDFLTIFFFHYTLNFNFWYWFWLFFRGLFILEGVLVNSLL
jgi:hypothetical protein